MAGLLFGSNAAPSASLRPLSAPPEPEVPVTAQQPPVSPGPTRRRVVTTGAHLAWSTPVILAASSLPAHGVAVSGAASIVTGQPVFTIPTSHVRVSTVMRNVGTVAPSALTVMVRLTPTQGGLEDRPPTILDDTFSLTDRAVNGDGSQTLLWTKNAPLEPNASTTLRFDFFATPSTSGIRQGNVLVSPSVPPPGSATSNTANYLSTVSA